MELDDLKLISAARFVRLYGRASLADTKDKRDPLLLFHGAPESHKIWLPYLDQLSQERDVFLLAFPSSQSDVDTPCFADMLVDSMFNEFVLILNEFADLHPSFAIAAHDFGAKWCFAWLRRTKRWSQVSSLGSFSVGPSFRYDLMELGLIGSLTWSYSLILSLSYYFKHLPIADKLLRMFSGYRNRNRVDYRGLYWYGPLWPFRLPFDMFGVTYLLAKLKLLEYGCDDDFNSSWLHFPIFFAADPKLDRIAYTQSFVDYVSRNPSNVVRLDSTHGHFFISNKSPLVDEYIQFLSDKP